MKFIDNIPHVIAALPNPPNDPDKINSQSGFGNLGDPVGAIFDVLILFIPLVAVIYLMISGYRYIVAQGNQDLVERAKKSLIYAVYGLVLAIVSVLLIITISDALGFKSGLSL